MGTVFQDIDSQMVNTVVEDELLYGLKILACRQTKLKAH